MSVHKEAKRITTQVLHEMKQSGEKIAMLTAYDYTMATVVDQAGVDIILVGDSASNVMAGHETTLPITLDQMIYHAQSVVRAAKRALVVVDLPFGGGLALRYGGGHGGGFSPPNRWCCIHVLHIFFLLLLECFQELVEYISFFIFYSLYILEC